VSAMNVCSPSLQVESINARLQPFSVPENIWVEKSRIRGSLVLIYRGLACTLTGTMVCGGNMNGMLTGWIHKTVFFRL
jgi:hypothetical protein